MTQEAIKKRQPSLVLADHENREIEVKSKCKFEYLPLDLGQEGRMYSVSERRFQGEKLFDSFNVWDFSGDHCTRRGGQHS